VANGMFQAWWPMEGEGEAPMLEVNGRRRRSFLFTFFHFAPKQLT